ncbi:MAG TPA: response regulator [Verrucomicrobiae bacterium]|jgi:CheY-like chemotaxis protein|nr:response regulator [Verrucomicrobiae bacterium]
MSLLRQVLLAEDDENDVWFMQRAFEAAGIDNPLQVAEDGEQAIAYLDGQGKFSDRAQFPLPLLMILDLKMPRKTGLDVLTWLRGQEILNCLPVIVFSSSAHPNDVELSYRLGANAFVVKPSSTTRRNDFARMLKGFWLDFNLPPLVCLEGLESARKIRWDALPAPLGCR